MSAIGIIAAVSTTSWISFERSKELLLSSTIEHMRTAYMQHENKILNQIRNTQRDTLLISKSEAIQGIIRAEPSSQNKARSGENWKNHLKNIFSETIKLTGYLQIRLIRLKDGKEIVRVDRNKTKNMDPIIKPQEKLQIKAHRDYVKQGLKLSLNEIYISPINLNREHGIIELPPNPTQRFITPVYLNKNDDNAYGIIVINTDASYINLDSTTKNDLIEPIVVNSTGGIIYHKDSNYRWGFEYGRNDHIKDIHPKIWNTLVSNNTPSIVLEEQMKDTHIGGKISLSNTNKTHFIGLILTINNNDVITSITALGIKTALIGLAAIIFVGFITILMVKKITQPIQILTDEVSDITSGKSTIITVHNNGELGKLGDAFSTLITKLQNRTKEAEYKSGEIQRLNATLENKVNNRTSELANRQLQLIKEIKTRTALNDILQLAMSADSAEMLANNALNTITELHFLSIKKKGIVFLADKEGISLNIAATNNINLNSYEQNAKIPINHCLPSENNELRKFDFSTILNEKVLTKNDELHDHYNILIKSPNSILGVVCLYLSPNVKEKPEETKFFGSVADILANALIRLAAENELHLSIDKTNQALLKQKQISEELVIASQAANAANQAKSNFLSSMSHEIRTPMNGMLGMAELLQDTALSQEQQEYLKVINQSGLALLDIINDILDFSKIEAGKLELELQSFNLSQATQDAAQVISLKAQEKGVELIIDYDENCPENFIGDARRIRQILLNLLSNALKFTHKGHIALTTSLLKSKSNSSKIHIAITDTGIGIEPEIQATLFQAFTQADDSTTRKYGGTGLGLAICKQLIELMEGEIGIDSVPNKGSTFWIELTLPVVKAEQFTSQEPLDLKGNTAAIDHQKLDAMRELLGDDFESLIHAFLSSATSIIESLPTAIENKDRKEAERLAHSLKSASANVGATTLSAMAQDAENLIRDHGLNNAKPLLSKIESEYQRVRIELEKQPKILA